MSGAPEWLDKPALAVYEATLPKVKDPTPDQLEMLAAYADAAVNLRRVRNNPEKARVWRGAMLYARNGLRIGAPVYVEFFDLLLDWAWPGESDPTYHLKAHWQLPEAERPASYYEIETW